MPRLDRLPQVLRNTLLTFPAQVNDSAPFAPLKAPLSRCRVTISGARRPWVRSSGASATGWMPRTTHAGTPPPSAWPGRPRLLG